MGTAALDEEILDLVRRMSVEAQQVAQVFAGEAGLHATDLRALLFVMAAENRGEPTTAGGLGAELGVTSGAVTGVVDRLVRAGHVERAADERDRRRVVLRHAPSARSVAQEFFTPLQRVLEQVLRDFRPDELATVHRFLGAMTDAMADHHRSRTAGGGPGRRDA